MAKLVIDGREIEAKDGQSVLQAALDHGIHIPHLCYHPALKVVGSCRMCLIEIEKVPKLQVACGTPVRDGMVVSTQSERVKKARRGVLEFLLINHPLDCPVCDQAGECKLQDYCFEHGQAESRYQEEKRAFPKQDLGATLVRDMNRCIHCTRCIRFLRDVAGAEAFTLYERGNRTQVGTYLETPVESPYSMNLVELCPVGALTSKHFRFKGRSWLMEKTRTLCAGCSRGCNVYAWSHKGRLLRLTPAENQKVNRMWLCDHGRLSIDDVNAKDRLQDALRMGDCVGLDAVLDEAAAKLKKYVDEGEGGKIGVVASARLTNEDNYAIRKLAREVLGTKNLAFVEGKQDDRPFEPSDRPLPEWFLREDKAPNTWGARDIIMSTQQEGDVADIIEKAQKGELKALLVFSEDLTWITGEDKVVEAEFLFVADTHKTRTVELAHIAVPEAAFLEKGGTYTNEEGRVQRLRPAVAPLGCARSAWQTVQELAKRMGAVWSYRATAEVTAEISAKVPGYQDLDYIEMPDEGLMVEHA
jgi:NADH-quinone oxidoreductase subunit G